MQSIVYYQVYRSDRQMIKCLVWSLIHLVSDAVLMIHSIRLLLYGTAVTWVLRSIPA